jgi:two-component system, sensor histidine kinase
MDQQQTILVVEDDADIRAIVQRLFIAKGYRVRAAADGITAFTYAHHEAPALVVLDLGLPGQDGWSVARELRADPNLENVPIIAITAYGVRAAIRAALAAGCQMVICKPFALATLEDAVDALLHGN